MIGDSKSNNEFRQDALAKLTSILYLYHEQEDNKVRQSRVVWSTFMAVIETRNSINRRFLFAKLEEFRELTSECSRLYSIAEEILRLQECSDSPGVDLARYMKF